MRRATLLLLLAVLNACAATVPRFGAATLFAPGIVSTAATEVRIAFSPDGTRMLWGTIGRGGGPGGWEIFESTKVAGGWSAPAPVSFDSAANDFDPSFAPDGSGVYFFSNREGGFGKDDLYFVPLANGRYGEPVNLGAGVNTPGDEWAPVVSHDGMTLLFATDGRGGKGKHDLFFATRTNGAWGNARNAGALNTADEDFDATFLGDSRSVVLSSGDFDGAVSLFFVPFAHGRYGARVRLGDAVNPAAKDGWAWGPSTSASEADFLYFTSHREESAGRADIYRVPFTR